MQAEALTQPSSRKPRPNKLSRHSVSIPAENVWGANIYGNERSNEVSGSESEKSEVVASSDDELIRVSRASIALIAKTMAYIPFQKSIEALIPDIQTGSLLLDRHYWNHNQFRHGHIRRGSTGNSQHLYKEAFVRLRQTIAHAAFDGPPEGPWENLRRDLGSLQVLWAQSEHVAPSDQALREFDLVRTLLEAECRTPDIEVDDETGEITLGWRKPDNKGFVCISIEGNGVVSLLARSDADIAQQFKLNAGEERDLATILSEKPFLELMT